MSHRHATLILIVALIAPALGSAQIVIQGGGQGGGGMGPGGVRFMGGMGNPAQRKQAQMDMIKEQFEASDEEWDKISSCVDKVVEAKLNLSSGAGISWSSQNGAPPVVKVSQAKLNTPVGIAMEDLRDALADKDTPPEEITKKLEAFNQAMAQARAAFEEAKKALKDSLSPRQQAILATMGMLD